MIRPLRFDTAAEAPRFAGGRSNKAPVQGVMTGESGGSGGSGGENNPPVAVCDSGGIATLGRVFYHPSQGTPNILDNDYDPDPGDSVWFSRVIQLPELGTLTMGPTASGEFEYTPRIIGCWDRFSYVATDGSLESNEAWVDGIQVVPPVVDADTDSDNTGPIDETPEEDAVEGEDPMASGGGSGGSGPMGNLIYLNRDDDDTNGVEDRLQGPGPLSFNDDDLEPMIIKVDDMAASDWVSGAAGGSEGLLEGVSLEITYSDNLGVWRSQAKDVFDGDGDGSVSFDFTSGGAPSGVPSELYVEGLEPGTGTVTVSLIAPTETAPSGEVVAADAVNFTVFDVNLTIWDGVTPNEVDEADEESRGAFTVANRNDTDGDGVIDNIDDDGVVATSHGKNEIDLMKLQLNRPCPGFPGAVTLTISPAPAERIRLWTQATKPFETEIPIDDFGIVTFTEADYPATGDLEIYAEAVSPSDSVRDITIEMSYMGISDTVKATGIWSELTAVEHDTKSAAELFAPGTPWEDMPSPPRNRIEFNGGTGLRPIDATIGVRNSIVMQFTVIPSGIESEPEVFFDVTRRKERTYWHVGSVAVLTWEHVPFPDLNEEANDDPTPGDESDEPDAAGHIFSEDAPGNEFSTPIRYEQLYVYRGNFEEFVRVNFGPDEESDPAGNGWSGSRASPKYLWHCRHRCENQGGVRVRSTGDAPETEENDVGDVPPHIEIGSEP